MNVMVMGTKGVLTKTLGVEIAGLAVSIANAVPEAGMAVTPCSSVTSPGFRPKVIRLPTYFDQPPVGTPNE